MPSSLILLSLGAALSGALHIRAEYRGPQRLAFVAKPLTTSLILVIALVAPGDAPPLYRALIAIGLAFSLAGDVFLMLPSDRFLPGLASFLVAHLLYIGAFTLAAGFQPQLVTLLPFALAVGVLLHLLWPQLVGVRLPVTGYVLIIATMGWQSLGQAIAVGEGWALRACLGAALFVVSDAALALNRFRGGFASAQLVVLGKIGRAHV